MHIYRAVARGNFKESDEIARREGRRLPSNVPYVVDNLWELARPENFPSRRHALYASATPELAAKNAAAYAPDGYVTYRMEFRTPPAMYQLPVTDARDHADIKVLVQLLNRRLGDWSSLPVSEKMSMAPLFLPGITKEELSAAMSDDTLLRNVVEEAVKLITFWKADQGTVAPEGELFFELTNNNTYTFHAA